MKTTSDCIDPTKKNSRKRCTELCKYNLIATNFKTELKALLEKYNANLLYYSDYCCDTDILVKFNNSSIPELDISDLFH
jgi:hypothetical protein